MADEGHVRNMAQSVQQAGPTRPHNTTTKGRLSHVLLQRADRRISI